MIGGNTSGESEWGKKGEFWRRCSERGGGWGGKRVSIVESAGSLGYWGRRGLG